LIRINEEEEREKGIPKIKLVLDGKGKESERGEKRNRYLTLNPHTRSSGKTPF